MRGPGSAAAAAKAIRFRLHDWRAARKQSGASSCSASQRNGSPSSAPMANCRLACCRGAAPPSAWSDWKIWLSSSRTAECRYSASRSVLP
ncbi:hypothetical protein [Rugamonas sp. DEMB1]|uniref:hypothetical protein n=1 Tax=Rugamonas sp. DEMB1 TaxID=3039386 RepID=UPI0024498F6C|nr:hypothetical protein [Rugamonas sp. DEMB1]WGG48506.1 hypothetical protein QC826_17620 [Rugamonas sp. DEMB1]